MFHKISNSYLLSLQTLFICTLDAGDMKAIHRGHLVHKSHGEGEGNEVSDDIVELNAKEGGMFSNPISNCLVIFCLSRSIVDLILVHVNTYLHDGTSNYETASLGPRAFMFSCICYALIQL